MNELTGKVAVVTGGSRGIGRAICVRLAQMGASVVIGYSGNREQAEITREACGERATIFGGDVSQPQVCADLFAHCQAAFGPPDILVNNAGITRDGLLMRMSEEDFDRVMDVNLKAAFLCIKLACRPMMKQREGRIVNVSSVVGLQGNAGQVNYCASKAGLIGMTKSAARELGSRGITVNAVAPGLIETDMTRDLPAEAKEKMEGAIPLGRAGSPEQVAAVVAFLCTEDAAYITGQVLSVDGGMHM